MGSAAATANFQNFQALSAGQGVGFSSRALFNGQKDRWDLPFSEPLPTFSSEHISKLLFQGLLWGQKGKGNRVSKSHEQHKAKATCGFWTLSLLHDQPSPHSCLMFKMPLEYFQ